MKRVITVLIVFAVFIGLWVFSGYNTLVWAEETVKGAWWEVENQYQRRFDLIPNLVETVKWAAAFEQETFQAVTDARSKVGQTNVDITDAESLAQYQSSQWELSSALSRLLLVMENYPQLTATQAYRDLMVQLEWTENRIATARTRYNAAAKEYRVLLRRFPTNILAGLFGFDPVEFFDAQEWADVAPKVDFNIDDEEETWSE